VYPVTIAGKILGGIIAILGIGLVALPAGIISSGFVSAIGDKDKKTICPHCGKEIG
jgi:voltage-gated potassium channel